MKFENKKNNFFSNNKKCETNCFVTCHMEVNRATGECRRYGQRESTVQQKNATQLICSICINSMLDEMKKKIKCTYVRTTIFVGRRYMPVICRQTDTVTVLNRIYSHLNSF